MPPRSATNPQRRACQQFETIARQKPDPGSHASSFYTINGFSAHADQAELLAWQQQTGAKRTFLVHGDEGIMKQFATHLADTRVEMPGPNRVFEL